MPENRLKFYGVGVVIGVFEKIEPW